VSDIIRVTFTTSAASRLGEFDWHSFLKVSLENDRVEVEILCRELFRVLQ
jgi:hypothetical protein